MKRRGCAAAQGAAAAARRRIRAVPELVFFIVVNVFVGISRGNAFTVDALPAWVTEIFAVIDEAIAVVVQAVADFFNWFNRAFTIFAPDTVLIANLNTLHALSFVRTTWAGFSFDAITTFIRDPVAVVVQAVTNLFGGADFIYAITPNSIAACLDAFLAFPFVCAARPIMNYFESYLFKHRRESGIVVCLKITVLGVVGVFGVNITAYMCGAASISHAVQSQDVYRLGEADDINRDAHGIEVLYGTYREKPCGCVIR